MTNEIRIETLEEWTTRMEAKQRDVEWLITPEEIEAIVHEVGLPAAYVAIKDLVKERRGLW